MLIVVIMGRRSDDSACWVVHDVRVYSVLDTVVISGNYVCCSVGFGTLVGVSVFSVMRSGLLMPSAINCPRWSSVHACQRVEFAFTSPMSIECDVLYVCANCFVMRGYAVSMRLLNVCNSNVFMFFICTMTIILNVVLSVFIV